DCHGLESLDARASATWVAPQTLLSSLGKRRTLPSPDGAGFLTLSASTELSADFDPPASALAESGAGSCVSGYANLGVCILWNPGLSWLHSIKLGLGLVARWEGSRAGMELEPDYSVRLRAGAKNGFVLSLDVDAPDGEEGRWPDLGMSVEMKLPGGV
ncbi:MAG TPA: hypothetical protein VIO60_00295, partial [Rectinemataceae bacterium]